MDRSRQSIPRFIFVPTPSGSDKPDLLSVSKILQSALCKMSAMIEYHVRRYRVKPLVFPPAAPHGWTAAQGSAFAWVLPSLING